MTVNAERPVPARSTGASRSSRARRAAWARGSRPVLAAAGAAGVACARRLEPIAGARRVGSLDPPDPLRRHGRGGPSELVRTALERFGRIDVCVNNAGTSSGGPERQSELQSFQDVLRVNLEAVFALSQLVSEPMRRQGSGSVINVSSMFGQVASTPVPDAGYVASKAAVNGLTRELANQWARGRRPGQRDRAGWFPTEMNDELFEDERSRRWLERQCPMGRLGREDELDGVLLFLASDASSYCTGQVIAVDGGWTIR